MVVSTLACLSTFPITKSICKASLYARFHLFIECHAHRTLLHQSILRRRPTDQSRLYHRHPGSQSVRTIPPGLIVSFQEHYLHRGGRNTGGQMSSIEMSILSKAEPLISGQMCFFCQPTYCIAVVKLQQSSAPQGAKDAWSASTNMNMVTFRPLQDVSIPWWHRHCYAGIKPRIRTYIIGGFGCSSKRLILKMLVDGLSGSKQWSRQLSPGILLYTTTSAVMVPKMLQQGL